MTLTSFCQVNAGSLWLGAAILNGSFMMWSFSQLRQLRADTLDLDHRVTDNRHLLDAKHNELHRIIQFTYDINQASQEAVANLTASLKSCCDTTSRIQADLDRYYIKFEDLDRLILK